VRVARRACCLTIATLTAVPLTGCGGGTTLGSIDLQQNALIGAVRAADFVVHVSVRGHVKQAAATLDGRAVTADVVGSDVAVHATSVPPGKHELVVKAGGSTLTRSFTVDTTPPVLDVTAPPTASSLRVPVTITGRAPDAVKLTAGGRGVPLRNGAFSITFPAPPAGLAFVATDAAGNETARTVSVAVKHPLMRGVHLTGYGWNADVLRNPVLKLVRQHKINTIELDIKEEDGFVNFDTSVALAHQIHAVRVLYDPRKVIPQLHRMGVRVVGRIVCFRDPKLAAWAWKHGHRDWDVQSPTGGPYNAKKYGGSAVFTNWASTDVQRYQIDLSVEAAKLGFDDVMYDYVRRPDGPLHTMRFPGATTTAPVGVANFVRDASGPVRSDGAYLGLAVFGVSATRPKEVGQNIAQMAKYVDYVAPMVYPSHWGPGEYGVSNPNAQPYAIVNRSLKDFLKKVSGTNAQVMPWLQDFSLGVNYGVPQVKAQIVAAARDGIGSWLLWNAGCTYQGGAMAVDPSLPRTTD
jgi:hypothetical protein